MNEPTPSLADVAGAVVELATLIGFALMVLAEVVGIITIVQVIIRGLP